MCNLYSITTDQEATRRLFRVVDQYVGNLPPMPGVFPDYPAPVIRNAGADRELIMMRWGMPQLPRPTIQTKHFGTAAQTTAIPDKVIAIAVRVDPLQLHAVLTINASHQVQKRAAIIVHGTVH